MIKKIQSFFSSRKEEKMSKDLEKLKSNVMGSFKNIKEDIEHQKRWINHLHDNNRQLNNLHDILHDKHHNHEKVHVKDIDNIHRWINHLYDNSKEQDKAIKDLEKNISFAFEKYNRYLVDLYRVVSQITTRENDSEKVAHGRPWTRLDAQNNSDKENNYNKIITEETGRKTRKSENKSSEKEYEAKTLEELSRSLTRSEKNILAELCNTTQKMSYKDIAMLTDLSSNTVKNHLCHIKNKGFPVKEQNDRNGVKRHYVPENVKKIVLSKSM